MVFEVDLLKSQEINFDCILGLLFEKNRQSKDKGDLIEEGPNFNELNTSSTA